ncbi:MAG: hypothetical protein QOJ68_1742 [Blastococcus sp.]|nr:hypothetical protein [Blastococcus sp.]
MPLRSVEAASRDDAIAAAREQFGPSARVVGVRRVRSGGVLGFFATERYVAEVAADPNARSAASAGSTPTAVETTGGFASSPLSAAAPATAATSVTNGTATDGIARASAPARNGAAAYARTAATAPRPPAQTEDPVSELAGLFADAPADPPVNLYGPGTRAAAPVTSRGTQSSRDASLPRVEVEESRPAGRIGLAAALDPAAFSPDAPSPFTAALARMAAGDRDVRDAVEVALDQPRVVRGRSTAGSWPSRSASLRSQDSSAPSGTTRQEEEPVGDQVVAPPSTDASHGRELPNWAAEPAPAMGSPREEAIAEVLRSALAQGHSDEALAGILRKMLAGASPQTALAEPAADSLFQDAPVVPAAPAPVGAVPQAAPITLSLAMALANAGSAVQPAEVAAPEPLLDAAVPEIPADAEPSMFDATDDAVPDVGPDVPLDAVADVPAEELETDAAADAEAADQVSGYEITDYEVPVYEPTYETASHETPAYEAPAYEPSAYRVPSYRSPAYESPLFDSPLFSRPTSDNTSMWGPSVASIWGEPTSSHVPLWGEPGPFSSVSHQADLPIWDDVVSGVRSETLEAALPLEAATPADEVPADDAPMSEPADEVRVDEASVVEASIEASVVEDDVLESALPEPEVAVLAPVFARTASDPAPMSLDATTVMPPLSLLPPLPGSRGGRGRPPVPPALPRSSSRTTDLSAARTSMSETSLEITSPETHAPEAPSSEAAAPAAPEARPESAAVPAAESTESASGSADDAAGLPVETASMRAVEKRAPRPAGPALATVTRLPVATRADDAELPQIDLFEELEAPFAPVPAEPTAQPELPAAPDTVAALATLGLPSAVLGEDFAGDVAAIGTYAALTRALTVRLPAVPELPTGAGEVLFVVGPGVETLRAARTLAAGLRLDPESVQWATRGDLAGLAPRDSRMTTVEAARQRRQSTADAGTVTIVAVDVPLRTDASWMEQMLGIWSPVAVWAVVEATRKPEDLDPWLARLATVDALIVTDTDLSGEPAAALRRAETPVAVVDGARATAHRWASLLCERLETRRA